MKFPIVELVDRYAISVVKSSETGGANKDEVAFYYDELKRANINPHHKLICDLVKHHAYVWSLENKFKNGQVDSLPLDEIGRIAIAVRDQGRERSRLKNALADLYGPVMDDPVREIKQYGA